MPQPQSKKTTDNMSRTVSFRRVSMFHERISETRQECKRTTHMQMAIMLCFCAHARHYAAGLAKLTRHDRKERTAAYTSARPLPRPRAVRQRLWIGSEGHRPTSLYPLALQPDKTPKPKLNLTYTYTHVWHILLRSALCSVWYRRPVICSGHS